jgi:c-di-GMP-binding flagellar brake protein YcgR
MQQEKKAEVCVGLEFGTMLQVQFEGVGSAKSSIIGLDREKYLIIKPPALVGIETRLFKKNQTVVRYFYDGMLFGFRCTLIGVVKTPFPLLILSYPDTAEQVNLRKHKRLSCLLNGQLLVESLSYKIVILDISSSGCRFAIPEPAGLDTLRCGLGTVVTITVDLNKEIQETVTFVVSVQNFQTDEKGLMVGGAFRPVTQQTDIHCLEKLQKYISTVQLLFTLEQQQVPTS